MFSVGWSPYYQKAKLWFKFFLQTFFSQNTFSCLNTAIRLLSSFSDTFLIIDHTWSPVLTYRNNNDFMLSKQLIKMFSSSFLYYSSAENDPMQFFITKFHVWGVMAQCTIWQTTVKTKQAYEFNLKFFMVFHIFLGF